MSEIYLDNNATTKIRPEVIETMSEVMGKSPLNPSSVHTYGRASRKIIKNCRDKIKKSVNANNHANVIFTSGGTEANNLIIKGLKDFTVFVSAIEHSSVLNARSDAIIIPVTKAGVIDLEKLEKAISTASLNKFIVSVMSANNETGIIQPIRQVVETVHAKGGIVHTDAIQMIGKMPLDMQSSGVDAISLSAHKFGGPQGIGALIANKNMPLTPVQTGGKQEFGLRAGTENVAAIAGLGKAIELLGERLLFANDIKALRDYMERQILDITSDTKIFGTEYDRLPNTSCITMHGTSSETQLINFDLAGIMISAGSACSSGKVTSSHVLKAMSASKAETESAIRVSIGADNTKDEIDKFVLAWQELYNRVKQNN